MPSRSIHRPLALAVALAATTLAAGNVTVNQWNSPTSFHHTRVGVPDQDQKRVGLPNSGACYCVPTSYVNMMIYIANHGYAQVEPGPGVYSTYEHYYDITNLLEQLGSEASISPGGPDPSDPDCNGGQGGDGTCGSLPCGGSITNVHNAFVADGFYGSALDDLVFTAKFLDPNAPTTSFNNLATLAIDGSILQVCFGRYKPVGSFGGTTVYKRNGGHCVTMNGIDREGSDQTLSVRDPGADEGDIFGPSPYATTVWDISSVAILTTPDDPEEGPIDTIALTSLPAINEPQADGVKRLIDGYLAIRPKVGIFWKDQQIIQNLPLAVGFGGDPIPHPAPSAPILDLVGDEHGIGWFVLAAGNGATPGQLLKMNPISGEDQVLATTTAKQIALSRFDELYSISESPAQVERRNAAGQVLGATSVPGLPRAIACDDGLDLVYVVLPGSSGFGGTIMGYPRSLGLDGAAVKMWTIAPSVQIGLPGAAGFRAAVNPHDGHLWITSASLDKAFGFTLPYLPRGPVAPGEQIAGFAALTGCDFDDGGTLYAVDGGAVKAFEKSSAGGWTPGDAGALNGIDVGSMVRIAKSRSNFDPALHDTADWQNVDDPEQLGTLVPDCLGDLDGNGAVDAADLAILLGGWGGTGLGDLDQSGVIDGGDLARLLGAWGSC